MNKVPILLILTSLLCSNAWSSRVPFRKDINKEISVIENYSKLAFLNYSDSLIGARKLEDGIKKFISNAKTLGTTEQTQKSFEAVKKIWVTNSRIPYGQTEIFRFYNGPIDFESIDDGVTKFLESINFEGVEGLLNAWPLDEAYIDYVEGDLSAGIINDPRVEISSQTISAMNEVNGEKNISTGYHAVEFLLWGQDRSLTAPGRRAVTDYTTAKNSDRRSKYLRVLSETIVKHLTSVTKQWTPLTLNFRREFTVQASNKSLEMIFTSLISMSGDELKSERIENALLLEDQEEEHSCFSDTTINDIAANAMGVKNVYFGDYKSTNLAININGPGIDTLVSFVNPKLNLEITKTFENLFTSISIFYENKKVYGKITLPFDVAIVSQKAKVQAIIDNLDKLDGLLRQAAKELGLNIDL
jgi:putative iron-regulated protein